MSVGDDIKTGLKEAIAFEQRNKIAKDLCSKYNICTCNNRDGHCSTPQQHAKIRRRLQEAIDQDDKSGHKKRTALGMKMLVDKVLNEYLEDIKS